MSGQAKLDPALKERLRVAMRDDVRRGIMHWAVKFRVRSVKEAVLVRLVEEIVNELLGDQS